MKKIKWFSIEPLMVGGKIWKPITISEAWLEATRASNPRAKPRMKLHIIKTAFGKKR